MSTIVQQDLPAATWALDNVHSTVGFAIKYMDATLDTAGDQPRLTGTVDPSSIQLKDENFHAHLQSPEFFDTERHPAITFESTSFRIDGDELIVDGNLTIKGDTRPVEARGTFTAPHEDPYGGTRLGVHLEAVVDRTHFGLNWNNPLPKGGLALANETKLVVDLGLVRS